MSQNPPENVPEVASHDLLSVGGKPARAMVNDVFDPDADTYEWHPTLKEAVEKRTASPENDQVEARRDGASPSQ